jgi:predicted HD phosphohydrolase
MREKLPMFRHFDEATAEDWKPIDEKFEAFQQGIAGQMIAHLQLLATHDLGYPVDRYVHSLQTATRALRDGADDEMVVCALLHDIGDTLAPVNHGPMAAAMLAPYITPLNAWMIEHHEEFQGYFYAEYFGGDKHARDKYRDHPAFARTARFTDEWDQKAFDRDYDTLPIEAFLPAMERVFARKPWGDHTKADKG